MTITTKQPEKNAPTVPIGEMLLALAIEDGLHDLSQPLTSVACAVELLLLGRLDDEQRSTMLVSAQTECERMMDVVNSLRETVQHALGNTVRHRETGGKDVA